MLGGAVPACLLGELPAAGSGGWGRSPQFREGAGLGKKNPAATASNHDEAARRCRTLPGGAPTEAPRNGNGPAAARGRRHPRQDNPAEHRNGQVKWRTGAGQPTRLGQAS
ncbi:hypothetical protein GCM10018785_15390 [Streptomyces longispororuber]|uniref:Uncharacterized protein n=1 Tax=Streptomyces longispororuber TaxID=68230 RepID=A0A919DIR9_9ACTN|nr:hypothetical protein GCM10018785_15390 [Streptomyces longispororuber]